jgi:hypothetical protein
MKVTTNTQLIESRAKWARRIAPVTMLLLLAGLITNFLSINQPGLFRITLILLGVGFVSAIISSHLVNHWVREPRADQLLTQLLKKFGNDYALFNHTSPVPHVLLAPNGLYTIVVKPQDGAITVSGRRASRRFDWRRLFRLLADEGLGSPVSEAEGQAHRLKKFLGKQLTEEQIPPVMPLIIFSGKNVQLTVREPAVPVVQTNELKYFLRDQEKTRVVSPEQRRKLAEILGGQ